MFDLSTSHLIQLITVLTGAIVIYISAISGTQRQIFKVLILIVPFQFIDSQYGSINMALTKLLKLSPMVQWQRSHPFVIVPE